MSRRVPAVETTVTHDCGFSKTSRTAGLAARALRAHSCDHQRELQDRAARVEARRTREGVKRDCQCPIANHEHGTRTAYVVDKCRCRPCTDASARAENERSKQKAFGRYDTGRVDATEVRAHILALMEAGVSMKRLAALTGMSHSTVSAVVYGRTERGHTAYRRVHKTTAAKILAIKADLTNMAPNRYIDSCGAVRRIQALVAIGWSQQRLAKMLGMNRSNFSTFMNADQCTVRRALAVRDLYDKRWNEPQTGTEWHSKTSATRSRNHAKARGWAPPLAWDDETIDDPAAKPDLGTKLKLRDTIADDVAFLAKTGATREEIADRLNRAWDTIERQLHRINRADIIAMVKADTRDNARHASRGKRAA
jgi:transcriptional regulator with XRE-family HTH domain